MLITDFYNELEDLDKIDWAIMKEKYWRDTVDDPDRRRRRQAEFLVHQFVDINNFLGFGVKNQRVKEHVEKILNNYNLELPVLVKPNFYF
jgi:DNA-binding transcriptional regulator YhcF (GntR family)